MRKITIPPELQKMNSLFEAAGFEAYLAGGAVRDEAMGKGAHDWDVATNATPQDVMKIFRRVIPTGIKHGTVTVRFMKKSVEVTTFRTESGYSDGRHPDAVSYSSSLEEDLARRDFTMNAMAASLKDGRVSDPFGGLDDIRARVIRTVGNPHERFMEDGLRPVRAVRFASQLGFRIEEGAWADIRRADTLLNVSKISAERFRDEFCKILLSPLPSKGLRLLEESGILQIFIPELLACRGCVQSDGRGFHSFDVLDHLFYACDGAVLRGGENASDGRKSADKNGSSAKSAPPLKAESVSDESASAEGADSKGGKKGGGASEPSDGGLLTLRLAALFHDIGKPRTKRVISGPDGEKITFYNHEAAGAKMAEAIMARLKFSNARIAAAGHLIKEHMFNYESAWSDAAVRRFVQRIGKENIDSLFDLRLADIYGMHKIPVRLHDSGVCSKLLELKERVDGVLQEKSAMGLKDLAVSGGDLIQAGIAPGKKMGMILRELFEAVTDDPAMNEREILLSLAKKLDAEKYSL